MTTKIAVIAAALVAQVLWAPGPAVADGCAAATGTDGNSLYASAGCSSPSPTPTQSSSVPEPYFSTYRWTVVCVGSLGDPITEAGACAALFAACPAGQILKQHFGLHNGAWIHLGGGCRPLLDQPTITPALVATAFQRIPLPHLRALTQPANTTLVNFPTLFHVEAAPFQRTVTLLGQAVSLDIRPTSFRWVHGDGTEAVTSTPGAAYPNTDVAYRYEHVGTVNQHVEVTWSARWRLGAGPWADVPGAVNISGPDTALQIKEAVPVLSGARALTPPS